MNYQPSPTAKKFHASTARYRLLMGPIAGGSTTACFQEIIRQCKEMPISDGIRRSRWLVLSPDIDHRRDCAMRVFGSLAYDGMQNVFSNEFTRICHFGQKDVRAEIVFRTSDHPEKYNNLEFTGVFVMDLGEHINQYGVESAYARAGRYPIQSACKGFQWGVIADSYFGEIVPEERGISLFKQPSALSTEAENLENLPEGYYQQLIVGKSDAWIREHITGEFL